ncbi:hypothetical protein SDC9_163436 [bioreactor metagenome]|uniref:Uncharacterized protein n=1 Tax=bioreactor metagenome TaxID=1076179 RepID=A0A645FNS9_9ZZZZ
MKSESCSYFPPPEVSVAVGAGVDVFPVLAVAVVDLLADSR